MSKKIEKVSADNQLFSKIAELIELARNKVATAVNLAMVHTYFEIGKMIIEDEQQGKERAEYGKATLKELSKRLTEQFGKGFSEVNLRQMRSFYETYAIQQTLSAELGKPRFTLSWSHYLILMRIKNADERSFYEIESTANHWSLRNLERQMNSSLFERLALSGDTKKLKQLSNKGQIVEIRQTQLKIRMFWSS